MIDQNYCVCLSDIASQVLPSFEELQRYLAHTTCHLSEPMTAACKSMYILLVGVPPARVNLTMIPTYFGHNPSGGSLTQFRDRALSSGNFQCLSVHKCPWKKLHIGVFQSHVGHRGCLSMADFANRHFMQMFANGGKFRKLDLGPKANQGYNLSIIERF